jgi:hypothetical protein
MKTIQKRACGENTDADLDAAKINPIVMLSLDQSNRSFKVSNSSSHRKFVCFSRNK